MKEGGPTPASLEGGGTCTAEQKVLPNSPSVYRGGAHRAGALQAQRVEDLGGSLTKLLDHRTPDGRYLMRHRYQWWAVYHVLVRQCGFPDGYREFVACIAQLFPEGLRVPCTESTMKQLSQTRYMEPVSEWRYDALYHGSPERFRLMRETVEWMGKMVNGIVRNGYPIEPT